MPDCSLIIILYVDDILIGYSDKNAMSRLVDALCAKYDFKCLGAVTWFLGMRIDVNVKDGLTKIDQFQFANEILHRFEMSQCKPFKTPLNAGTFLISASR
ncbi:hypothetical protein PR001_g23943 [Phytophthora rubi]|nr:hypothetical protein PR001_g23943 [Phytophthora rubi]